MRAILRFTLHIILLSVLGVSTGVGDENVRIAGMGGVKIGMNAPDAGLFGNPAALLDVESNNLSVALSVENYRFEELPQTSGLQFASELTLGSQPSIYYSRAFGEWGVTLGRTATLENLAKFEVEATRSEYIIDRQHFSATTEMVTGYNLFWESRWAIGVSRGIDAGTVGVRLKQVSQTAKRGRIVSVLNLESQHARDVNPNDPRELIPAIIDGIDFSDPTQYLGASDEPIQDLTMSTFEIDLGYQRDFSITEAHQLRTGLIVENLLQRKLIRPLPLKLGIGAGYEPLDWIGIGIDIWRVAGYRGLDFALGGELYGTWDRGFTGAAALRGGLGRIDTVGAFSVGVSLAFGSSHWEYTLRKRFRNQPLRQATHLFASTIRF